MKYRTAREKLCYQTRNLETQKKKYHKLCFAVEKAEIKAKMTNPADAMYETRKKLDELQEKTDAQMKKYNKHIEKWKTKYESLQKMSEQFEDVYQSREEDRAKVVLAGLQNSVELTMAGNYTKRESGFTRINAGDFVKDTLVQTENVTSPKFEQYKGETDRNLVYMAETKKTEVMTLRNGRSSPEANTATADENNNRQGSNKTNMYVVIRAYERQQVNQLNLKLGEHVTEILPANEDGYAYGHVIHGLLHKKKKGFFPMDHVVRLQEEVADPNNDDKKERKKSKKGTKSARNGVGHVVGRVIVDSVTRFEEDDEDDKVSRKDDVKDKDAFVGSKVESEARRRRREKKKKEEEDMVIELL